MSGAPNSIIDTCCLLDLYAGWDGLQPLKEFSSQWYVCSATMREARYLRDYDAAGQATKVPIDLTPALHQRILLKAETTDDEFSSFLKFATELGDGEAMSLAIAMQRGWTLATDDRKAAKIAEDIEVKTISTPEIIEIWIGLDDSNVAALSAVLQNIERRARFKPAPGSPLYEWWNRNVR